METGLPEKRGGTNQFSDEHDTLRTATHVTAPFVSLCRLLKTEARLKSNNIKRTDTIF